MRHLLVLASLSATLLLAPVAPAAADIPPSEAGVPPSTPPAADDSDDCSTSHAGADVGESGLALALAGAVALGLAARRRR
jgi:MYXO-CTERM domain-containing protein